MTGSSILSRLFGDRFSKSVSARRKRHSRLDRPTRSPHLEGLEKRQMLTVTPSLDFGIGWNVQVDRSVDNSVMTINPVVTGGQTALEAQGMRFTFAAGANESLFVNLAEDPLFDANAYAFSVADSMAVGDRIGWDSNAAIQAHLQASDPNLLDTTTDYGVTSKSGAPLNRAILQNYNINGFNTGSTLPGFRQIRTDADIDITYLSKATFNNNNGTWGGFQFATVDLWDFNDIEVTALDGGAIDPSFTYRGNTVPFDKPTLVDFNNTVGASTASEFRVSAPLDLQGDLFVRAHKQTFNANAQVTGDIQLTTWGDGQDNEDQGISIGGELFAANGDVYITGQGANFSMQEGAEIGGNNGGQLDTFTLDLTDASAQVSGEITANSHLVYLRSSVMGGGGAGRARSVTTIDPETEFQSGSFTGNTLSFQLANQTSSPTSDAVQGEDGVINIQSDINNLQVASGTEGTEFDYLIDIENAGSFVIDAEMASKGDITLTSTAGTIDVQAALLTSAGLSLTSQTDLDLNRQLRSGKGDVVIESVAGNVTFNAAAFTGDAGGQIRATAAGSVVVNSALEAISGVIIDAGGDITTVGATSEIESASADLTAGGLIDVGMKLEESLNATAGGDIVIRDVLPEWTEDVDDDDPIADFLWRNFALELMDVTTTDGSITVDSIRSIDATRVEAGGTGDILLTTSEGSIMIDSVIAEADDVTLVATGVDLTHDSEGVNLPLGTTNRLGGTVMLRTPLLPGEDFQPIIAESVDVTVWALDHGQVDFLDNGQIVDDGELLDEENFFAGVGRVGASVLTTEAVGSTNNAGNAGDIIISTTGSVIIERAETANGAVTVVAQGSVGVEGEGITATGIDAAPDVTLVAVSGGLTVGSAIETTKTTGVVTLVSDNDILFDSTLASVGVNAGIVGNVIDLYAGLSGQNSDIGTEEAPLLVSSTSSVTQTAISVQPGFDNAGAGVIQVIDDNFVEDISQISKPSSINISSSESASIAADTLDEIVVTTTGADSTLTATGVLVDNQDGIVRLTSGHDIVLNTEIAIESGANSGDSKVSLIAGRYIDNFGDNDVKAKFLTMEAQTFNADDGISLEPPGQVRVGNVDTPEVLSVSTTSATGQIVLEFDRESDLELDGVTAGGLIDIKIEDTSAVQSPSLIIGAGNVTAGASSSVTLTADLDIKSTDEPGVAAGQIVGGTAVINADIAVDSGVVDVRTAVGQIAASAFAISVDQAGDIEVAPAGLVADTGLGDITLGVDGSILPSTGEVEANALVVTATGGVDLITNVTSITATTAQNLKIVETDAGNDDLTLGTGGLVSTDGDVTIVLKAGGLDSALQTIAANGLVSIAVEAAGDVGDVAGDTPVLTNAGTLSAVTFNGDIHLENAGGFAVGDDGIIAGNGVGDIKLVANGNGAIVAGTGDVQATNLVVEANDGIALNTTVEDLTAASATGDINFNQSDQNIVITTVAADAGSVSMTTLNSSVDISTGTIEAANDVTLLLTGFETTAGVLGVDEASVELFDSAIVAGGAVSITAAGSIESGNGQAGVVADITADTVTLLSNDIGTGAVGVDVAVAADQITASALGVGDLFITQIGSSPIFLGSGVDQTLLTTTGELEFHSVRVDGVADANDIVVLEMPSFVTDFSPVAEDQSVIYVVSTASMTADGNLGDALINAGAYTNEGVGPDSDTKLAFDSNLRTAIRLSGTIDINGKLAIDGRERINTATGGFTTGRPVDIDGSRMTTGTVGFNIVAGADETAISGLALYGFNGTGGAAIKLDGVSDVVIENNSIGLRSNGRASRNENGILVGSGVDNIIRGNTIARSTGAAIEVEDTGAGVDGLQVTNNFIGTNSTRRNYRNGSGIVYKGIWDDSTLVGDPADDTFTIENGEIRGNFIAYSSVLGLSIEGTEGVQVTDNQLSMNRTGISIGTDAVANTLSSNIDILNNEIVRSYGNGIFVGAGSRDIMIGGDVGTGEGNRVGTNSSGRRGLGNRRNGVYVKGAGANVEIVGNQIIGNGSRRSDDGRNGVKVEDTASKVTIDQNTINMNREAGVYVKGATSVVDVTKNTIFRNYESGIVADGTAMANVIVGAVSPTLGSPTSANGNTIISNRRYAIDQNYRGATASGELIAAGNAMLGNRRGGINASNEGAVPTPVIQTATFDDATNGLTIEFSNALSAGDEVYVYAGTGRSSRSQGLLYLGKVTSTGGTSLGPLTIGAGFRVRFGTSITVAVNYATGGGTSGFARNVSTRRA